MRFSPSVRGSGSAIEAAVRVKVFQHAPVTQSPAFFFHLKLDVPVLSRVISASWDGAPPWTW